MGVTQSPIDRFSYSPQKGGIVGKEDGGYSVGVHGREVKIAKHAPYSLSVKILTAYSESNDDIVRSSVYPILIGIWRDGDYMVLDCCMHVRDREAAIALGREHLQKAIWDFENESEIPV